MLGLARRYLINIICFFIFIFGAPVYILKISEWVSLNGAK